MIRIFTPIWIIVYLALIPLVAMKYTTDVMFVLLNDTIFKKLPIDSSFRGQQNLFACSGFWVWACLFWPVIWILLTVLAMLYRTWMLFYQTFHMCRFRSKYNGPS
mmetsp:Transcript_7378/g.8886  ORF Transcript_7378/g.8886 Transcript_7378/m.8886 type:complete len:105 (+) Transcript_7378:840-1154(+)